jgi:uncharacterized protein
LSKIKVQLAQSFGVQDLAVFGSVVRGEATSESDLDLLVSFSANTQHGLSFFRLQNLISKELGIAIDLVTIEEIHPTMRDTVLAEACYV